MTSPPECRHQQTLAGLGESHLPWQAEETAAGPATAPPLPYSSASSGEAGRWKLSVGASWRCNSSCSGAGICLTRTEHPENIEPSEVKMRRLYEAKCTSFAKKWPETQRILSGSALPLRHAISVVSNKEAGRAGKTVSGVQGDEEPGWSPL